MEFTCLVKLHYNLFSDKDDSTELSINFLYEGEAVFYPWAGLCFKFPVYLSPRIGAVCWVNGSGTASKLLTHAYSGEASLLGERTAYKAVGGTHPAGGKSSHRKDKVEVRKHVRPHQHGAGREKE